MVNNIIRFYFTLAVLLIFVFSAQAQTNDKSGNSAKLLVLDQNTQQPIPFANVCYEQLLDGTKYYRTTTQEGIAENPVLQPALVAISFVGYKTIKDTVQKGKSKTYQMEQDIFNMDQVVVTGTRTRKTLSQSPIMTKVVNNIELKEAGAVTALDALEYSMPGVQFSPDGHGDNLQIQGLDNDYILVLIDGERMVGETRGNVNFDRLVANEIERIEIVNGASSVLYGSNAIGAVINIITKNGKQEKPFETVISSRYSKYNEMLITSNIGYSGKKMNVNLSGFRSSTDGYDLTPETPASYTVDKNTDYSGKLKIDYKINKQFLVSANSSYYQHEVENPEKSTKSTHSLNRNITYSGKILFTPNNKNAFELRANTDQYNAFTVYEKKNDEKEKGSDYSYSSYLLTHTWNNFKKLELISGVETNYETVYSLNLFGEGEGQTKNAYDVNGFIQADYKLAKDIELIAGIRNTYHQNYGNHFSPKLSVMYSPWKLKFRGNVSKGYKAPTLKELYYNFDHHGMFMIFGNPELKPEDAFYTSLSAEYTHNKINTSITAYYNSIKDKIESVDRINAQNDMLEKHYLNVSEARLKGIEGYFSVYIIKSIVTKFGYAYSDALDKSTNLQLYGNSKHSATFALTYKFNKSKHPLSISLNGRASSGRLYQTSETETDENTGENIVTVSKDKSSPYMLWKIVYNQNFKIAQKYTVEFQAGINNVFNYTDTQHLAVIDPGRRFFTGIKFNF
jgi:outer membrane receptor for ferrienterochelin and colicins